MMAYFSFSKGFKSGGWTTRLSNPIPSPVDARFNPEYDKTYELGLKSQWFDHHLPGERGGLLQPLRWHPAERPGRPIARLSERG